MASEAPPNSEATGFAASLQVEVASTAVQAAARYLHFIFEMQMWANAAVYAPAILGKKFSQKGEKLCSRRLGEQANFSS